MLVDYLQTMCFPASGTIPINLIVPRISPQGALIALRVHDAELVLRPVNRRLARRPEDLVLVAAPLRVIDAVDPLHEK